MGAEGELHLTKALLGLQERSSGGQLHVLEPKDVPYLHTGHSLVFTIARNGHVWGKRLDGESSRGDIELEVFWPREDGCLIKLGPFYGDAVIPLGNNRRFDLFSGPAVLQEVLKVELLSQGAKEKIQLLSQSQQERIRSILSQKEIIQYELGTLMVRPGTDTTDFNYKQTLPYRRMDKPIPLLRDFNNEPCNIKVVDCSYGETKSRNSYCGNWTLNEYRDDQFKFYFLGNIEMTTGGDGGHFPVRVHRNMDASEVNRWYFGEKRFYAVQAERGRFDISGWLLCKGEKFIKPELRIMYGEHDFFEYFAVDDAVLMLEMEDAGDPTKGLFWTLGIAQNKHIREMTRLASNNPDLFVPLLSLTRRRVSEGATDTMS